MKAFAVTHRETFLHGQRVWVPTAIARSPKAAHRCRRTRSVAKGMSAGIPRGRGQYTHVGKGWSSRSQAASTRKARSIRGGDRVRRPEVTFEMTHVSGASAAPRPVRNPE